MPRMANEGGTGVKRFRACRGQCLGFFGEILTFHNLQQQNLPLLD